PELAVQSRKNHTAWRENGKLVWTDPSNPKVQDYDIALAKYVAGLGVDEIQFDYVRFPAEGDQQDAMFVFQQNQPKPRPEVVKTSANADSPAVVQPAVATSASPKSDHAKAGSRKSGAEKKAQPTKPEVRGMQRSDVIAGFLKKAYAELHPTGVLLSL